MHVALIDYGSGNLASAAKALARAAGETGSHEILVTADPDAVREAERIVLPGVGAFADCMHGLSAVPGWSKRLTESVIRRWQAVPGHLCRHAVDGDARAASSAIHTGLGWIDGEVVPMHACRSRAQDSAYGLERD